MSTPDNLEGVMRRIEKLLAISRDHRANPQEAANAAAMAAATMRKYQLDESAVIVARLQKGDDLGDESHVPVLATWVDPLKRVPKWARFISVGIANLTSTKAVQSFVMTKKGKEACITFMGYKADVALAVHILQYLQRTMRLLRLDFQTTYTYKTMGLTSLRSYTEGMAIGICDMLRREQEAREAAAKEAIEAAKTEGETDASRDASRELVLVNAKLLAVKERYGEFKVKSSPVLNGDGFSKGYADGNSISIRTPIDSPRDKQLQLKLN